MDAQPLGIIPQVDAPVDIDTRLRKYANPEYLKNKSFSNIYIIFVVTISSRIVVRLNVTNSGGVYSKIFPFLYHYP